MIVVQFIFFRTPAKVVCRGGAYAAEPNSIVLTDSDASVIAASESDYDIFSFRIGDFQELYRELADEVDPAMPAPFWRKPFTPLPVPPELFDVARRMGSNDRSMMLRFLYIYCLNVNRGYFSNLLHHFVDGSLEFFDYIERNSLNPWPVETYARELGISMRNLNQMFQDKFGVSTKHWLLERRLQRARELLLRTSKKVTDIAHECGFNSHAHFSDTFRKRYNDCPRRLRQGHVGL